MATDYGIGIDAILDRPDPERLASGTLNFANRLARRVLTTNGALIAIGDTDPYQTLNLRDYLGARPTAADIETLNTAMQQVLSDDDEVESVTATATFADRAVAVAISGDGAEGPFDFLLTIDRVTGVAAITVNP